MNTTIEIKVIHHANEKHWYSNSDSDGMAEFSCTLPTTLAHLNVREIVMELETQARVDYENKSDATE